MHNFNLTWSGDNAKRERDSDKPKDGLDTRLCQVDFLQLPLKMGRGSQKQQNIPLEASLSDDRQQKTDSADSCSGLSTGHGGSRDINPAFDSESQDEVITIPITIPDVNRPVH